MSLRSEKSPIFGLTYKKDTLLPSGVAGSSYQVKILMLYAFKAFCDGERFALQTEAKNFGKFDDLVLWRADCIQVLQAKHSYSAEGKYLLEHLIKKEGGKEDKKDQSKKKVQRKKVVLSKYFDSWLQIESKKQTDEAYKGKRVEYIFFTNHALNKEDGLEGIYDSTCENFSDAFLSDGAGLASLQKEARKSLLHSIYTCLADIQQEIIDACNALNGVFKSASKMPITLKALEDKRTSPICKLLTALELNDCIVENAAGKYQRKVYQFTDKFINDTTLPPVLKKLKEILAWNFERLKAFRFETAKGNFFDSTESEQSPSAVSVALYTGFLGSSECDFLFCDLSDIDTLISKAVTPEVVAFFKQFQFKVEQPNEVEMTAVLEEKISRKFNNVDRSYYLYFYEFMLKELIKAAGESVTESHLEILFNKAKLAFDRNALVGHSKRYEYHLKQECDISLEGKSTGNLVESCLDGKNPIVIYYANDDFTVAMSICKDLRLLTTTPEINDPGSIDVNANSSADKPSEVLPGLDSSEESAWRTRDTDGVESDAAASGGTADVDDELAPPKKRVRVQEEELVDTEGSFSTIRGISLLVKADPKLKDGEYGFIDAGYAVLDDDHNIFCDDAFKILVIDRAYLLAQNKLKSFVDAVQKNGKKLILLSTQSELEKLKGRLKTAEFELDDCSVKEIPKLDWSVIQSNIASKTTENQGLMLGTRFISFDSIKESSTLSYVMQTPYYLSAILSQAVAPPETHPVTAIKLGERPRIFVPPTIEFQTPVYRLNTVLEIKRPIWVINANSPNLIMHQLFRPDLSKLREYLSKHASDKVSLRMIFQEFLTGQPDPELICFNREIWELLSSELKELLLQFERIVFYGETPLEELKVLPIQLRLMDDNNYFELVNSADYKYMPETVEYRRTEKESGDKYKELFHRQDYPCKTIILSDYGSGKSHLTEQLVIEAGHESSFSWIIRIAMKMLTVEQSSNLTDLAEHYLGGGILREWQRAVLSYDIVQGNVLWILDGFDEMLPKQREEVAALVSLLTAQPNCIVASRPNAAPLIPFQPNQFIEMQPFDEPQINDFVQKFFAHTDEVIQAKALQLIASWKKRNNLTLLGKPLLCRIACEIISDKAIRLETSENITLAMLFDCFMMVNLRKFHHDHNRIPLERLSASRLFHLSKPLVDRLKLIAHAKLFERNPMLIEDETLDRDIIRLGLISNISEVPAKHPVQYTFNHQTQVEYFTALYLVENLLKVPRVERESYIQENWANYIYNIQLRVVWQFVAGIVTSEHSLFMEGSGVEACEAFGNFLIAAEEDLVGIVYNDLMNSCARNMNFEVLKVHFHSYQKFEEYLTQSSDETEDVEMDDSYEIVTHLGEGHKSVNDDQIIEKYAYKKPYTIANYSLALPSIDYAYETRRLLDTIKLWWITTPATLVQFKYLVCKLKLAVDTVLVHQVRDELFKRYQDVSDFNNQSYQQAYAMIIAMIDANLISLGESVKTLTDSFKQKNCLLEVVSRLERAGLLTQDHIDKLFSCSYPRFWDYDAGLPAILILKEKFCLTMKNFLVKNILERSSGDWEVSRAYEVFAHLTKEAWDSETQVELLLIAFDEINGGSEKKQDLQQFRQNIIRFQNKIILFSTIKKQVESSSLENILKFQKIIGWLFNFAKHHQLVINLRGGVLWIQGEINQNITISGDDLTQQFIRLEMKTLRQNRKDPVDIDPKFKIHLSYQDMLQKKDWSKLNSNMQLLIKIYIEWLPRPDTLYDALRQQLEFKVFPDKDSYAKEIRLLRIFNYSLDFIDKFFKEIYEMANKEPSYWEINYGISAIEYLENDFGQGAYNYLRRFMDKYKGKKTPSESRCYGCFLTTLEQMSYSKLSNPVAIQYFLRLAINSPIQETGRHQLNAFGKALIENIKENFEENALLLAFRFLRKQTDLSEGETVNLELIRAPWVEKCKEVIKRDIEQARLRFFGNSSAGPLKAQQRKRGRDCYTP